VSKDTSDTAIHFTGKRCHLFDYADAKEAASNMSMERIKEYGKVYLNADGSIRHWLYTWDNGWRVLQRCQECGALFLVQFSEFHDYVQGHDNDSYYTDWFQVDDESSAELINATWDGFAIESRYDGPAIFETDGAYAFRNIGG
jgi:hypothetical protein